MAPVAGAAFLPRTPPGRLEALDVLRGIAVLLVLGAHLIVPPAFDLPIAAPALRWWADIGPAGVDLFFVLSGFLVAGLLLRERERTGSIAWGRFFVRRGFKIYPGFYALLLATWAVDWNLPRPASAGRMLAEGLFVQNYFARVWTHTWSLAVEEHFYLLLPTLVLLFRRGLGQAALGISLGVLVLRALSALLAPEHRSDVHEATHLRLDSLLVGVCLAQLHQAHGARLGELVARRRGALRALALALILPPLLGAPRHMEWRWVDAFGPTALALGFGAWLLLALHAPPGPRRLELARRLVAATGFYSYSIYLWHLPVLVWLVRGLGRQLHPAFAHPVVEAASLVALSLGVGVLLARLIEVPMLKLRDRWFPSRAPAVPQNT